MSARRSSAVGEGETLSTVAALHPPRLLGWRVGSAALIYSRLFTKDGLKRSDPDVDFSCNQIQIYLTKLTLTGMTPARLRID